MNKKKFAIFILLIFFIILLFVAYKYIKFSKEYATTDAMFIRSDMITNLSFKRIRGKIAKMYVKEGDFVKKGELVAEIDPVDYKIKLEQVNKNIESLKKKKEQAVLKKERIKQELTIKKKQALKKVEMLKEKYKSIKFQISNIDTNISQLKRDYKRYENLYKKNVIPKRDYESIETKLNALKDKKLSFIHEQKALLKQIEIAKYDVGVVGADFKRVNEIEQGIESLTKQIELYISKAEDLKHSISYCKLYAPFTGKIGKKYSEVGMNVKSGYPVYSLVDVDSLYVEVLLEETKLKGVEPGCKAYFTVDSYPDKEFEGIVEKIYPASAATYALVPRDISAGEFTKVAQRILIRVKITGGDKSILLAGMGGEIKIRRKK